MIEYIYCHFRGMPIYKNILGSYYIENYPKYFKNVRDVIEEIKEMDGRLFLDLMP